MFARKFKDFAEYLRFSKVIYIQKAEYFKGFIQLSTKFSKTLTSTE